jgi:hypothetical protein
MHYQGDPKKEFSEEDHTDLAFISELKDNIDEAMKKMNREKEPTVRLEQQDW